MDLQLDGKTALVTGSSKGIGEAIARKLAQEKATVVVHGRDRTQAERVAHDIIEQGGRAHVVMGDLTHDYEVQKLVEQAETFAGAIDVLVNNAGGSGGVKENWTNAQPASWMSAYDRNVLAALRVTTRLLPGMRRARWGRVINISSLAATMPPASGPDYSACKAAINAMTASLAKAVAAEGITVNAVSPGHDPQCRAGLPFPGGCCGERRRREGRAMGGHRALGATHVCSSSDWPSGQAGRDCGCHCLPRQPSGRIHNGYQSAGRWRTVALSLGFRSLARKTRFPCGNDGPAGGRPTMSAACQPSPGWLSWSRQEKALPGQSGDREVAG